MNYRHAFHAGNHADVLKHLALVLILSRLAVKDKPFFVLDTHAGRGLYDLASDAARRSPEFETGIARLFDAPPIDAHLRDVFEPYLAHIRAENPDGGLRWYPGSPALIAACLRGGDRFVACERHPQEYEALQGALQGASGGAARSGAGCGKIVIERRDGYEALRALLPPTARRGLVLIDPPFEAPGEFDRLATALKDGARRFAHGVFMVWYPIKDHRGLRRFNDAAQGAGFTRHLTAELTVKPAIDGAMAGSGLFITNPPFGLAAALTEALAHLAALLRTGSQSTWHLSETENGSVNTHGGNTQAGNTQGGGTQEGGPQAGGPQAGGTQAGGGRAPWREPAH